MEARSYQWIIGILVGVLLAIGGGIGGSIATTNSLGDKLDRHVGLPAHPVTQAEMEGISRRLERLENKQDQILELLRSP